MFENINWVSIIVALVIHIALGFWWYSFKGFGKKWIKLMGFTQKEMAKKQKKGMGKQFVTMTITSLVLIIVLDKFITMAGATTLVAGAQVGLWIWLGFLATTMIGSVLWEGKKVQLYYINTGYYLVSLAVNGAVLALL